MTKKILATGLTKEETRARMMTLKEIETSMADFLAREAPSYTESLLQIISGAEKDLKQNAGNLQWNTDLLAESKAELSAYTAEKAAVTYTGCTSAPTFIATASATKRGHYVGPDGESSGSESEISSEEDEDAGKETSFAIYKNKNGKRSKHTVKEKIKWKNSYSVGLTIKQMTEDGPRVSSDVTLMITKMDIQTNQAVRTIMEEAERRRKAFKEAGKLKREPLKDYSSGSWLGKSKGSWSGNSRRR